jgi:hypothetical protein
MPTNIRLGSDEHSSFFAWILKALSYMSHAQTAMVLNYVGNLHQAKLFFQNGNIKKFLREKFSMKITQKSKKMELASRIVFFLQPGQRQ